MRRLPFHVRRGRFYVAPPAHETRLIEGFTWDALDAADLEDLNGRSGVPPAEIVQARLLGGHRCFGFRDPDGSPVTYVWTTTAQESSAFCPWEGGLRLEIPPRATYIWACRTLPPHEGQGLYTRGLLAVRAMAGRIGSTRVLICTHDRNRASRRGIEKAGFYPGTPYVVVRAGRRALVWQRNARTRTYRRDDPFRPRLATPDIAAPIEETLA